MLQRSNCFINNGNKDAFLLPDNSSASHAQFWAQKHLTLFFSDFPSSHHLVNATASVSLVLISAKWAMMWPPSHFLSGIKVVRFNPLPQSEYFLVPLTCSFNDIWSPEERKWPTRQLKQSTCKSELLVGICTLLLLLCGFWVLFQAGLQVDRSTDRRQKGNLSDDRGICLLREWIWSDSKHEYSYAFHSFETCFYPTNSFKTLLNLLHFCWSQNHNLVCQLQSSLYSNFTPLRWKEKLAIHFFFLLFSFLFFPTQMYYWPWCCKPGNLFFLYTNHLVVQ